MNHSMENQNNYIIKLVFDSVLGAFPLEGSAEFRPTDRCPTKRNVTGMIGAAMGIFLENRKELLKIDQWYDIFCNPESTVSSCKRCKNSEACPEKCRRAQDYQCNRYIYTDFQTVHEIDPGFPIIDTVEAWKRISGDSKDKYQIGLFTAKGTATNKTLLIRKQYIQNPYVTAYLVFPDAEHGTCVAEYLKNPIMPLYFGRKNCSFSRPVFDKSGFSTDEIWTREDHAYFER